MENKRKTIHEKYHATTRKSTKIINANNFTYRLLLETIQKYFSDGKKEILDIGCGAGSLSFYLANKGNKVTGIDISEKAINECIKSSQFLNIKNVTFLQADFPYKINLKKTFDGIIFTEVIEHLENDTDAIKKIYTLLKKNGLLILSTPSAKAPLHRMGLTKNFDKNVGHLRRYQLEQLIKLLEKNHFKVIKTRRTEGLLRNFLFVNPYAGELVRFLNFSGLLSDLATFIDKISQNLFGESNYIIVAKKI